MDIEIVFIATFWALSVTAQVGPNTTTTSKSLANISCIQKRNFVIGSRIGMSANKAIITIEGDATGSAKSGFKNQLNSILHPVFHTFFADRFLVGIGMDFLKTIVSQWKLK